MKRAATTLLAVALAALVLFGIYHAAMTALLTIQAMAGGL